MVVLVWGVCFLGGGVGGGFFGCCFFFFFFFLAAPEAHKISWARDQTHATAATQAAAVTMLDP